MALRLASERWAALAKLAKSHLDDHELVFVSLHYLMALLGAGQMEEAGALVEKLRSYAEDEDTRDQTQAKVTKRLALCWLRP